jgi:hypothetical protein
MRYRWRIPSEQRQNQPESAILRNEANIVLKHGRIINNTQIFRTGIGCRRRGHFGNGENALWLSFPEGTNRSRSQLSIELILAAPVANLILLDTASAHHIEEDPRPKMAPNIVYPTCAIGVKGEPTDYDRAVVAVRK